MEQTQLIKTPRLLDIIRINSRWAQICSLAPKRNNIKYLDNNSREDIQWENYKLIWNFRLPIWHLINAGKATFTTSEIENIRWGPEENALPRLRLEVHVFGEYAKK